MLFDVIEFGMNAQEAVEAPRFQTRHLVSSFDNHAMSPGDLLLDERIAPAVVLELADRRHKVGTRTRWGSGASSCAHPHNARMARSKPKPIPMAYRVAHAW